MRYLGSKAKLAQHIIPIIDSYRNDSIWIEPFVGGANIIDKVNGNKIGNDNNEYLIALLKAVQQGWIPPTNISKEDYYDIKLNKNNYPKYLVGFVGFLCSFGGKWWGGYAFDNAGNNYAARGSRVLTKQAKNFTDVEFIYGDYLDLKIPDNSIIYCDPPYENTTKYNTKFNHQEFWQWCRIKKDEGFSIFISEYNAPLDFKCLLTIPHNTILNKNKKEPKVEKLFTL